MLKVFLVEDESLVREALRDSIPWEQHGFHFAGEAADGEMALPLIRKAKPDLLITDIKMPFMDGLSLAKLVGKELPDTKIIIISGHEDFEYAKEAISLRVEQYILKPVTKAELFKALGKVREKIEEEREQKDYLRQFQIEAREYEQYARRKFFEQMTAGTLALPEIYERAEALGLDINAPCYNIVLFTVQPGESAVSYDEPLARLQEELMQYFLRYPEYLLFRSNLMSYAVLIKGEEGSITAATRQCVENIQRRCDMAQFSLAWYAAIGEPVGRLSSLPQTFSLVNQILSYRHLLPQQHILTAEVIRQSTAGERASSLAMLDVAKCDPMVIRSFVQNGLVEEISDFVNEYIDGLGTAVESAQFRQYLALSIRINTTIAVKELGYSQEDFTDALECGETNLMELGSEELKRFAAAHFQSALALRDNDTKSQYRDILKRALRYIDKNFSDENISLNAVARDINVSANYFSAIFSQEMGVTFVEYLTQKRMEKAKNLLRKTAKRSGEIAFEVGYRDPRYFSFLFKKTQGCTPSSFRAQEGAQQ